MSNRYSSEHVAGNISNLWLNFDLFSVHDLSLKRGKLY